MCIQAARAGKHVYTTKPMDVSVQKCNEMIDTAREHGVLLAVDYGRRYSPAMRLIRTAIREGRLGKPFLIDFRLKWHRDHTYFGGWRGTWKYDGGASMMNQGVHFVDMLYWFFGPVRTIMGTMGIFSHEIETEDAAAAILRFENGAIGVAESTTSSVPSLGSWIEVHGTAGSIQWSDKEGIALWQVGDESAPPAGGDERPRNIAEDIVMTLKGEKSGRECDGVEGRRAVEIITAIYESARLGAPVVLDQRSTGSGHVA